VLLEQDVDVKRNRQIISDVSINVMLFQYFIFNFSFLHAIQEVVKITKIF
jgi:hypothetical protein